MVKYVNEDLYGETWSEPPTRFTGRASYMTIHHTKAMLRMAEAVPVTR